MSHRHSRSYVDQKVESLGEENTQGGQASKASKKDDRGEDAESYVDKEDDSNLEMSQELI